MLVLSRLIGERVIIRVGDEEVVITVVDIRTEKVHAGKVRLGFEAPEYIEIDRKELRDAKDRDWRPRT